MPTLLCELDSGFDTEVAPMAATSGVDKRLTYGKIGFFAETRQIKRRMTLSTVAIDVCTDAEEFLNICIRTVECRRIEGGPAFHVSHVDYVCFCNLRIKRMELEDAR